MTFYNVYELESKNDIYKKIFSIYNHMHEVSSQYSISTIVCLYPDNIYEHIQMS